MAPPRKQWPELTAEELRRRYAYDPHRGLWLILDPGPDQRTDWWPGAKGSSGHYILRVFGKNYLAHRLAWLWMTGSWPTSEIDHADLDKGNNRWGNLREATHQQNQYNAKARSTNRAGSKGVCFDKRRQMWRATISSAAKRARHLGYFPTAEEAAKAYREASERFHGEHGRLQ